MTPFCFYRFSQLPYLILSSVMFVIPFFFIVGFDKDGTAEKFFWYWLFQGLYMSVMVFVGHFLANALPNPATSNGKKAMRLCLSDLRLNAQCMW
jgi:ABC-type multidrug transport system permease subunit